MKRYKTAQCDMEKTEHGNYRGYVVFPVPKNDRDIFTSYFETGYCKTKQECIDLLTAVIVAFNLPVSMDAVIAKRAKSTTPA